MDLGWQPERIHHALCVAVREQAGWEASPTTAIIDSARASRARKKEGFARVDTLGLLLSVAVHPANIQDRDGVALVLNRCTRRLFLFIERIYGDGG
jgi:hypothetical protein